MKKTELICIIDRSGSMASCREDAQGGFNTFIEDQKALDIPCKVTLYQFDGAYEQVWERQSLKNAPPYVLEPRGSTALLDAIGRTITNTNPKANRNVIVLIVTDGGENASREYNLAKVKALVEEKQGLGWSFVFVGAGIDAFEDAGAMGIATASTLSTAHSADGYSTSYAAIGQSINRARRYGGKATFTEEEQEAAQNAE